MTLVYPFLATAPQLIRRNGGDNDKSVPLPRDIEELRKIKMVSLPQAMAIVSLRNDMVLSRCTGTQNTFHLGGAPGSGKTACVTGLIASLVECGLVSRDGVLMCSKSNAATLNLRATNLTEDSLVDSEQFRTVNSGFAIPVIDASMDVNNDYTVRIKADRLRQRIEKCLGSLELLVMDEYMMTDALETVFIDAILRITNNRSEVPFGGVAVIFLGDNRQNSSIPSERDETSLAGHKADVLTAILKQTFNPSNWICKGGVRELANARLLELFERKTRVSNRIEKLLKTYRQSVCDGDDDDGPKSETVEEDLWDDEFDKWSCDFLQTVVSAMDAVEKGQGPAKTAVTDFGKRVREVSVANLFFCNQTPTDSTAIKNATLDVFVEEGLRLEIDRLQTIAASSTDDLQSRLYDTYNRVLEFVRETFEEIVTTGREKMYVLSTIGEYTTAQTPMAMAMNETLVLKLAMGQFSEDKCIAQLIEMGTLPMDQDEYYEWLRECVHNALFRTGREMEDVEPLALVLFSDLPGLMNRLSDPNMTAQEMLTVANEFVSCEERKPPTREEDYDPYDECSNLVTPPEIKSTDSLKDRAHCCLANQIKWSEWLTANSSTFTLQRYRFWHLYLIARAMRVGFINPSGRLGELTSLFGHAGPSVKTKSPYWLRALSVPSNLGNGEMVQLPAYSSMLSLTSRSILLTSLKRISVASHAYGLMYGLSLYDLTTSPSDKIDCRSTDSFIPNNHSATSNMSTLADYLRTIFPDMMTEFFAIGASEIKLNELALKGHMGLGTKLLDKIANYMKASNRAKLTATALVCGAAKSKIEFELGGQIQNGTEVGPPAPKKMALMDAKSTRVTRNVGSIALMKSNACKNIVASIVEMASAELSSPNRDGSTSETNTLPAIKFTTRIRVGGLDVTPYSMKALVPEGIKNDIASKVQRRQSKGLALINKMTDRRLLKAKYSRQAFTRELIRIREDVTKASSVVLATHQSVVFTTTNSKPYIFGTDAPFYAAETGVITEIKQVNGELVIVVVKDRSDSAPVSIRVGRLQMGPFVGGKTHVGAEVNYLPLASQQTITIYSSQGWTLSCNTLVDPRNASCEDAYVAVTRNSDPRQLRVLSLESSDLHVLKFLKNAMGKDRAYMFPMGGGIVGFGGDSFFNHYSAYCATKHKDGERSKYASLGYGIRDTRNDLIHMAQRYVLDRSGNTMAFNERWMRSYSTHMMQENRSLTSELEAVRRDFFGHDGRVPQKIWTRLDSLGQSKLLDLFMAAHRSMLHFRLMGTDFPSPSLLKEYANSADRLGYCKFDPVFISPRLTRQQLELLFYDVFPHSLSAQTFGVYAHFLFMTYELAHVFNLSFAFLPAAITSVNGRLRPSKYLPTDSMQYLIPGDGLGWESEGFADSRDGGRRKCRIQTNAIDKSADEFMKETVGDATKKSYKDMTAGADRLEKSMHHNLRRVGKYCLTTEVCGLSKHGAIALAVDCENLLWSHINSVLLDGFSWTSTSFEANLYTMLVYHLRLAAASAIWPVPIRILWPTDATNTGRDAPLAPFECSSLPPDANAELSEQVLMCGTSDPMRRVQVALHVEKNIAIANSHQSSNEKKRVFVSNFESKLGGPFESAIVVVATHTFGEKFAAASTLRVRNAIANENLGLVLSVESVEGGDIVDKVENLIVSWANTKRKRLCFFISLRPIHK